MKTFQVNFTEAELETISAAMDDYIHYDDSDADVEDLIGGLPVYDRVKSIERKISDVFAEVA